MFKKKDPNTFTKYFKVFDGSANPDGHGSYTNQIGYLIAEYHVLPYENVEVKDANSFASLSKKQFILHCTQRIVLYNPSFQTINPIKIIDGSAYYPFENYPALINTFIAPQPSAQAGFSFRLIDYSPKTINTKVQSSGSSGISKGSTQSSSISNTVGSSTSQTNSYSTSVSANAGFFGDALTGGAGVTDSSEHSSTTTHDQSHTLGSGTSSSQGNDHSSGDSMSIKDWGAYSIVNPQTQQPTWFFGQEYPWDAILCRLTDEDTNPNTVNPNASNQINLKLPADMANRLYDGNILYPPSQLSMFGFNFVMKVAWLLFIDYTQSGASSDVELTHNVNYYSASHSFDGTGAKVYLDKTPTILQSDQNNGNLSETLNLIVMALGVLGHSGKPAIIGFLPKQFHVNPSAGPFKILSSANTLLIEDTTDYGASYPTTLSFTATESALIASPTSGSLSITAYFKVVDTINDYNLYLKHWITGTQCVKLTITINGCYTFTKFVTALEAEGGENNLLTLTLRKQDFSSVDYHDYLQLGLNAVVISIEALDGPSNSFNYQIRAISIER